MIEWHAIEFHYHEKDPSWDVFVIVGAFFIGIFALWQRNLLFFIFTLIATMLMLTWGKRRPRRFHFMADNHGLWVEKKLYPYKDCTGFALYHDMLQMHQKNRFHPLLSVIIHEKDEDAIRDHLLAFLPEVEYTESFNEALAHWLQF